MNALFPHTLLSPKVAALDQAQASSVTPFHELDEDGRPPIPALSPEAYSDPVFICRYEGQGIYRLACGLIWSPETGCAWTIEDCRQDVDRWWKQRDAPGWEAGSGLWP